MQGSNILLAASGATLRLLKIDQGRSLCVYTTRMFEVIGTAIERAGQARWLNDGEWILSEPAQYTRAFGLTSSRFSDYSLAKEHFA